MRDTAGKGEGWADIQSGQLIASEIRAEVKLKTEPI
jgi:hypothetical protein